MITSKDRSQWFGASDTSYIIGNYETKTFKNWWLEKLGIRRNDFSNLAMKTGSHYEHKILDTIPSIRKDHQIIIPHLKLRVNLDGDKQNCIYEVKTYNANKTFKVSKQYKNQVLVQMYVMDYKDANIVSYALLEDDYLNYYNSIDIERINYHKIEYDEKFINEIYLPRLKYLCACLSKGVIPRKDDVIEI